MKYRSLLVCVLLAIPAVAPGANKDIVDLQREIGLLQQQVKELQKSQDDKFTSVLDLVRQSVDIANRANAGVAAVTATMNKSLPAIGESVTAPIAGINSRLNEMGGDLRSLQNAQTELAGTLAKLQMTMDDLNRQVKSLNTPRVEPPPPVQQDGASNGGSRPGLTQPATPESAPMSSVDMYNAALTDYRTSKYELAVQGFTDFLKWYPMDKLAPNAQFYIGMVHYTGKNFELAVKDFDAVLDHYNPNPKTSEAMLYKAKALVQLGRRTDGVNTFKELLKDDPKSEPGKLACDELKNLGMNCPAVPANHTQAKRGNKK
jgi:TolA-binding protein